MPFKFVIVKLVMPQRRFYLTRSRQRGQMAIFIALIFQVLFVLFAMAINVALVVHDKINLQNAVDLAAYYAAQRQAEMLNVIAHQNYTIRQSFKLLAWRYRALGAAGQDAHPWKALGTAQDVPFRNHTYDPGVCITQKENWSEADGNQTLCRDPNVNIPPMPVVVPMAPGIFNAVFAALSVTLKKTAGQSCATLGAYNWWYAMSTLTAFRIDQRHRKHTIYALANNLSSADPIDLDGNSIRDGANKTFVKNLTFSNAESGPIFQFLNSLEGRPRQEWLNEIQIVPTMIYLDPSSSNGCKGTPQFIDEVPEEAKEQGILDLDQTHGQTLIGYRKHSVLLNSDYQYSMGVEKNPWVMAYVGVQAQTSPRQIFFPFGNSITIRARAFAKPFGGRIGPWSGSRWVQANSASTGVKTDPLLPPLISGLSSNIDTRAPNYSRFPGDGLGLRSRLAIASIPNAAGWKSRFRAYQNIWKEEPGTYFLDPLALDFDDPKLSPMRFAEIAAIAPDLFDATYYSIEPNFGQNYFPKIERIAGRLGIANLTPFRGDLGYNPRLGNRGFSVADQMKIHTLVAPPQPAPLARPDASWFIRDKANLLTSWAPGETLYDFTNFPTTRFGKCQVTDDDFKAEFKVPGSCAAMGGRTGYSVRLISRDYLFSNGHPIGGTGESPGRIKNQPPSGW